MRKLAVYPGSFDPITNGHLDILYRALAIFDRVIVGIADNVNKQALFTPKQRVKLITESIGDNARGEVDVFSELLTKYVHRRGAKAIVRGLRAGADFEYEFQLALMNRRRQPDLDTVFLMTDETNFYVS